MLCNSFCKACFAFKSCKNNALLKLPLPAKNSDNNISCMRGKITTLWWRFLCWNLHPLVRNVIVWICCWQQDFQQALFMQLLIAQQALQKELQNTKMFFQHFHSEYMYCLYTAIWTAIGQKNILHFGNSSANIVLHSKAAKTPSCWKCCCQQQTGTKKLLTKGAKIQQHGVDFALAILNILSKDFYCLNCLLVKVFAANFVHADL